MIKKAYIIFSKIPAAGFSKTRLIPVLGARVAANVQLQMLKRLLQQALRLKSVDVFFAYRARDGDNPRDFLQYLPKTIKPFSQIDSDLGKAMAQAMITVQQKGYQQVVLTGSDLPKLTTEIIEQAFRALNGHDTVLGPTLDGGFYLIGTRMSDLTQVLTIETTWGTTSVLSATRRALSHAGLSTQELGKLIDIDTVADIERVGERFDDESHIGL